MLFDALTRWDLTRDDRLSPLVPGLAELAWSPKGQSWEEYRQRLAAHGSYMDALGINFYRAPEIEWK